MLVLLVVGVSEVLKGKLAHNSNDNTFIQNYHIVLFGDYTNHNKKNNNDKMNLRGLTGA